MAYQEIWVDNVSGDDGTGDGSSGNPYASIQGALDHGTLPTDGRAIYVLRTATAYSGANNTNLNFTTSNNPSASSPIFIIGVENTSKDDPTSLVELDCGSTYFMNQPANGDYVFMYNLSFHSDGTTLLMDLDNNCGWVNCEFYFDVTDASSVFLMAFDTNCFFIGCYFHDVNHGAVQAASGGFFYRCMFIEETGDNGTHSLGSGISMVDLSTTCTFVQCAFRLDKISGNFLDRGTMHYLIDCSFHDDTAGIQRSLLEFDVGNVLLNCLFDGFDGASGEIVGANDAPPALVRRNWYLSSAFRVGDEAGVEADNTSLTGSPFTNGGAANFAPTDTEGKKEVSWPTKIGGTSAP